MTTISFLKCGAAVTAVLASVASIPPHAAAQDGPDAAHARGSDLKEADATGGSARFSTAVGGSIAPGSTTAGTVTAYANGRQIHVSAAQSASVNVKGSDAEVKIGGQTLLVQKATLSLDGQPLGNLPPETKKIEVTVKEGLLSVKGDGKEFARAKLTPPPPQ